MAGVELVLFVGGAWCVVLGLVVAQLAAASRADERFEAPLAERRARRR
jgi:hypothetical protein